MTNFYDDDFFNIAGINEETIFLESDRNLNIDDLIFKALKISYANRFSKFNIKKSEIIKIKNLYIYKKIYIHILISGISSSEIEIPINLWKENNIFPDLILNAQVNQENQSVYFRGALTTEELNKSFNFKNKFLNAQLLIPTKAFKGGIDRYFSLLDILENNIYEPISSSSVTLIKDLFLLFFNLKNKFKILSLAFVSIIIVLFQQGRKDQIFVGSEDIQINSSQKNNFIVKELLTSEQDKEIIVLEKSEKTLKQRINNENIIYPKIYSFLKYDLVANDSVNQSPLYETSQRIFIKPNLVKNERDIKKLANFKESCFKNRDIELTYLIISKAIKDSNLAEIRTISCDDSKTLSEAKLDNILITSGIRNKEAVICLSEDKKFPCKFIVGAFNKGVDSSNALKKVFKF
jgi:hypothetical protein